MGIYLQFHLPCNGIGLRFLTLAPAILKGPYPYVSGHWPLQMHSSTAYYIFRFLFH